ncbi:MAG: DUF4003 family protein [Butyrivibrio sp.]|nr:DUF4003 family protein [Butyrivibrio sp.]MBR1642926.1 DUF4003 family protein [Butyrivibrio sp.]
MNETLERRCELLVENQRAMCKSFMLEHSLTNAVVAAAFAEKDQQLDVDQLRNARKLLKERKGVFSEFRSYNELMVSAKMALSADPEDYIEKAIEVYDKFQKGKILGSAYRVLAAVSVVDQGRYSDTDMIIEKTNALLKGMKKEHPFLTSDEDTCFAVLLAMTDKNVENILPELEESYQIVKKKFAFHDNAAYSLAQVLTAYEGDPQEKCERAIALFNAFKEKGAKYGKEYELASLGALIDVDAEVDEIVSEVIEVADHLKGKKGFGVLDMGKDTKLMFGTMLVSGAYMSGEKANASSISGEIGRVVALQTAILITMMMIMTTTAIASSSH